MGCLAAKMGHLASLQAPSGGVASLARCGQAMMMGEWSWGLPELGLPLAPGLAVCQARRGPEWAAAGQPGPGGSGGGGSGTLTPSGASDRGA